MLAMLIEIQVSINATIINMNNIFMAENALTYSSYVRNKEYIIKNKVLLLF